MSLAQIGQILLSPIEDHSLITSVQFDSRKSQEGALFFALKGERVDGHAFLEEVAQKGAVAAVVADSYKGPNYSLPLIRVASPLAALQKLASHLIAHSQATCVGITGSIGKTTTKAFTYQLTRQAKHTLASEGSCNSQAGLPRSLINQWDDPELVIAEMGINQKGEMPYLTAIVKPHIGVMTRLVYAHTEKLESLESIAYEKSKLFASKRARLGLFHKSNLDYEAVKALELTKKSYALEDAGCDYTLIQKEGKCHFYEKGQLVGSKKLVLQDTGLLENLLVAYAVGRELGIATKHLLERMDNLELAPHRFNKVIRDQVCFIDDSYNANPYAVKVALSSMLDTSAKRRIAVLGAMAELGEFSDAAHEQVAQSAYELMDEVFFLGSAWRLTKEVNQSHVFESKQALQKALFPFISSGDAVLIKGSNGLKMWELIEAY